MTETKFCGVSCEMPNKFIWQYVQYFNGIPVARFFVKEGYPVMMHKPKVRLQEIPKNWLRKMIP